MTVPFRHAAELEAGGNAAFLRIVAGRHDSEKVGALLQINARGEPIEFTFNQMELPAGALWQVGDLDRHAARMLVESLFNAAQRTPLLLLCLAREIPPALFRDEVVVQLPLCRVAVERDLLALDSGESTEEKTSLNQTVHLFWRPVPPAPESPARRLIDAIASRGMLVEPFERILAGIKEALAEEPK